jgi:nitrous oxide reductase accessory protein NosL
MSVGQTSVGSAQPSAEDTDGALVQGIVESLSRICGLGYWGCSIRATAASASNPTAAKVAASMAVHDMLTKASWSPEAPGPKGVA